MLIIMNSVREKNTYASNVRTLSKFYAKNHFYKFLFWKYNFIMYIFLNKGFKLQVLKKTVC